MAVIFWAEWCVPSRAAVETVEPLASDRPGPFRLGVVNVDETAALPEKVLEEIR